MEVLEAFSALSPIIKVITVIGFLMPLAVLHTFLNPEPSKDKKSKTYIITADKIKVGKIEFEGSVKEK